MKKILYIIAKCIVFLILGELIFRFENSLVNHEIRDFKKEIVDTEFSNKKYDLNVLLLGDSFTKGLGIEANYRIASQIRSREIRVVDSSRSGDNWVDYYRNIIQFESLDTIDFVVIGVNWNDVGFPVGAIHDYLLNAETSSTGELKHVNVKKGINGLIPNIYSSKLISTLSGNVQNQLKRIGCPLPIGNFHYFRTKAYPEHSNDFKVIWSDFNKIIDTSDTEILLYLMPDFNLTQRVEYFNTFVQEMNNYKSNVHIINGIEKFRNAQEGEYCISVQDGHPNAAASKKIANEIMEFIFAFKQTDRDSEKIRSNITSHK